MSYYTVMSLRFLTRYSTFDPVRLTIYKTLILIQIFHALNICHVLFKLLTFGSIDLCVVMQPHLVLQYEQDHYHIVSYDKHHPRMLYAFCTSSSE